MRLQYIRIAFRYTCMRKRREWQLRPDIPVLTSLRHPDASFAPTLHQDPPDEKEVQAGRLTMHDNPAALARVVLGNSLAGYLSRSTHADYMDKYRARLLQSTTRARAAG